MDCYDEYFSQQVGGGREGVGRIYIGNPYQKGHGGIGSFLAGIFRRVLPLITRGVKAVGKEALRTGANIVSDVTSNNVPLRESFETRVRESGKNLKRKANEKLDRFMEGSGYKKQRITGALQLIPAALTGHIKRSIKRKSNKNRKSRSNKSVKNKRRKKITQKDKKNKKNVRINRDIFG